MKSKIHTIFANRSQDRRFSDITIERRNRLRTYINPTPSSFERVFRVAAYMATSHYSSRRGHQFNFTYPRYGETK